VSQSAPVGPFPGWLPFSQANARYFVGRVRESRVVADTLLARSISVLYGPSGAGKSSLVRAGLSTALRERSRGQPEFVVCSSWGLGGGAGLRAALTAHGMAAAGETDNGSALDRLTGLSAGSSDGRVLLVLDQFEELLSMPGGLDEEFLDAVGAADPRVKFLISMREDALSALEPLSEEIRGVFEHLIGLRQLGEREAREAIVLPVERWNEDTGQNATVEPGLIDTVLAGCLEDRGRGLEANTTRLQLAMARVWEESPPAADGARLLRLETLEQLGGVDGVVAGYVDAALDQFSARDRDRIDRMFTALITPTGAKVPLTTVDLASYAGTDPDDAQRIANGLTRGVRLLEPVGEERYQLAHDALARPISEWRGRWGVRRDKRFQWRRMVGIMLFVSVLLLVAAGTGLLRPLELASVDARFELRGALTPPHDMVLVRIDDASLSKLGSGWPLPRKTEAEAITDIGHGAPRVIAYDVDFGGVSSEVRPTPVVLRETEELALAVQRSRQHVVLAAEATAPGGQVNVLGGKEGLAEVGARAGYSGFPFDSHGVIRHPVYSRDGVRSFAVATAEVASGRRVGSSGVEAAWIDYYGPEGTFASVSLADVLDHRVPSSFFHGKVVIVGLTANAYDRHPVWGTGNSDMSGVEVQANAIETIRRHLPLKGTGGWLTVVVTLLFALLPALPRTRLNGWRASLAITLSAAGLYLLITVFDFDHGIVLPVVAPLSAALIAAFALVLLAAVAQDGQPSRTAPRPG
jgi:CHASE2 domain-containing sensor protein